MQIPPTLRKISPYAEIIRPLLCFMGTCMAIAGAAMALRTMPPPLPLIHVLFGIVAVFVAVGAMHTINDYFDRRRDRAIWPSRPLPSGKLSPGRALLLASGLFAFGLVLAWYFFNPTCFVVLSITIALGVLYSRYLRDKLGYLSLAPIIGLFPVGGYAAFAPDMLLHDAVPWILYLMITFWQAGHILVYSPFHGIRMKKGGIKTAVPAFIVAFSPRTTALLGTVFFSALLALSVVFYSVASLSLGYLVIAIISGAWVIRLSLKLIQNPSRANSLMAFRAASYYAMILCLAVALDALLGL